MPFVYNTQRLHSVAEAKPQANQTRTERQMIDKLTPPTTPEVLKQARDDFPILRRNVNGKPLIYLDNAASTQKPQSVIDAISRYYSHENANIHRGVHLLSTEATAAYEEARRKIARYLNAQDESEIIFTRGATESINLIAHSFLEPIIKAGEEILISHMEHHANIVPWQLLAERTGARLRVAPIDDQGNLELDTCLSLMGPKTKLVAIVHVSNAIGTVNPIEAIIAAAREKGIATLIDCAQSIQHMPLDIRALGCDFAVFSGHKIFGPTGIGVLYGRRALLDEMRPYQGGGDMISRVSFDGTTFKEPPSRFEAGTPNIAGAIGLGFAIDYIDSIGRETICEYESQLIEYAVNRLNNCQDVEIIGSPEHRSGAISFTMANAHPHDIGTILDAEGVAIRTGHHCCEPLMNRFGIFATARASIALYNNSDDIDTLVDSLAKVQALFG